MKPSIWNSHDGLYGLANAKSKRSSDSCRPVVVPNRYRSTKFRFASTDIECLMKNLTNSQFLELLSRKNIRIHSKDERLQISAPTGAIDTQLHTELVRRKSDLLTLLERTESPA